MRIKDETVNEILETATIESVVSKYVTLKKKGANYWAISPFSKEKTPSFAVNPIKGIFKCFSTGKGGNAINFIMEMEGLTYYESLVYLAKEYGIKLPQKTKIEVDNDLKNQEVMRAISFAQSFFAKNIENRKSEFDSFLAYRKISIDSAKKFHLGISDNAWNSLHSFLNQNAIQEEVGVNASILSKNENGNIYDTFRDRIMFPIHNAAGRIISFGGRSVNRTQKEQKYINGAETSVYHKKSTLYGLNLAKMPIKQKGYAILEEGYLDVILSHQFGFDNAIATCGTALTREQASVIRRYAKTVVLVYDGDSPGIKAALKAVDVLVSEGLETKVVVMPDDHDPDSFLNLHGADKFQELIDNAMNFIQFKLKYGVAGNSPIDKRNVITELTKVIANSGDEVLFQLYARDIANLSGIEYATIFAQIQNNKPKEKGINLSFIDAALRAQIGSNTDELFILERAICEILVTSGDAEIIDFESGVMTNVSEYVKESLGSIRFFDKTLQFIASEIMEGNDSFAQTTNEEVRIQINNFGYVTNIIQELIGQFSAEDIGNVLPKVVDSILSYYRQKWHEKLYFETVQSIQGHNLNQYLDYTEPIINEILINKNLDQYIIQ